MHVDQGEGDEGVVAASRGGSHISGPACSLDGQSESRRACMVFLCVDSLRFVPPKAHFFDRECVSRQIASGLSRLTFERHG